MEYLQSGQYDHQRKDSSESSVFDSSLGARAGTSLQNLDRTSPSKRSPNVSPDTYFGARRPAFDGSIDYSSGKYRGECRTGTRGTGVPTALYPGVGAPGPMFFIKVRYPRVCLTVVSASWICRQLTERNFQRSR